MIRIVSAMAGDEFALGRPETVVPLQNAVDTNTLATRLLPPSKITPHWVERRRRVSAFFAERAEAQATGLVPSTVFRELVHLAIRSRFLIEVNERPELPGRGGHWVALFKERPELLARHSTYLNRLPSVLATMNIAVLQPEDFGPFPAGTCSKQLLIDAVNRYFLDSNDASNLIEMQQAGIDAIVTKDADVRRAARDFRVYTWLRTPA
jgi:predicted nucleic acid-binding protein